MKPTFEPSTRAMSLTMNPTFEPSTSSMSVTMNPTLSPTQQPTMKPTFEPSTTAMSLTMNPTLSPTKQATMVPALFDIHVNDFSSKAAMQRAGWSWNLDGSFDFIKDSQLLDVDFCNN